jgi:hypothetical protein
MHTAGALIKVKDVQVFKFFSLKLCTVYVVREDGWEKVFRGDVLYHHDKYSKERQEAANPPNAPAAAAADVEMDSAE